MKTDAYDAIQIPCYLGEVRCREEVLPLAREMELGRDRHAALQSLKVWPARSGRQHRPYAGTESPP